MYSTMYGLVSSFSRLISCGRAGRAGARSVRRALPAAGTYALGECQDRSLASERSAVRRSGDGCSGQRAACACCSRLSCSLETPRSVTCLMATIPPVCVFSACGSGEARDAVAVGRASGDAGGRRRPLQHLVHESTRAAANLLAEGVARI